MKQIRRIYARTSRGVTAMFRWILMLTTQALVALVIGGAAVGVTQIVSGAKAPPAQAQLLAASCYDR